MDNTILLNFEFVEVIQDELLTVKLYQNTFH